MGEKSVKLPPPLAAEIDQVVENKKDEFGVRVFRSRADFVKEACTRFLRVLVKETVAV